MNSTPYGVSPQAPKATCRSGHHLWPNFDKWRIGWKCDVCGRISEVSTSMFHCAECDYDICNTCAFEERNDTLNAAGAVFTRPAYGKTTAIRSEMLRDGFVELVAVRGCAVFSLSFDATQWIPYAPRKSLIAAIAVSRFTYAVQMAVYDVADGAAEIWFTLDEPAKFAYTLTAGRFLEFTISQHPFCLRFNSVVGCDQFVAALQLLATTTMDQAIALADAKKANAAAATAATTADETEAAVAVSTASAAKVGPLTSVRLQVGVAEFGDATMVRDFIRLRVTPYFDRRCCSKGTMVDVAALAGNCAALLELLRFGASSSLAALQALVRIEDLRLEHLACAVLLISYGALPTAGKAALALVLGDCVPRQSSVARRMLRLIGADDHHWPFASMRKAAQLENNTSRTADENAELCRLLRGCKSVLGATEAPPASASASSPSLSRRATGATTAATTAATTVPVIDDRHRIADDVRVGALVTAAVGVIPQRESQLHLLPGDVLRVTNVYKLTGWLECESLTNNAVGFVKPSDIKLTDFKSDGVDVVSDGSAPCERQLLLASIEARLEAATLPPPSAASARSLEQLIEAVNHLATKKRETLFLSPQVGAGLQHDEDGERALFGGVVESVAPLSAPARQRALRWSLSWSSPLELDSNSCAPYLKRALRCGAVTVVAVDPGEPAPPAPPASADASDNAAPASPAFAASPKRSAKVRGWRDVELVLDCGFLSLYVAADEERCAAWPIVDANEDRTELYHRRLAANAQSAVLFRHHVCHLRAAVLPPPRKAVRLYTSLNARAHSLVAKPVVGTPAVDAAAKAGAAWKRTSNDGEQNELSADALEDIERDLYASTFPTPGAWLAVTLGVAPTVYIPMATVDEAMGWVRDIELMLALYTDEQATVDMSDEWVQLRFLETVASLNGSQAPLGVLDVPFCRRVCDENLNVSASLLGGASLQVVSHVAAHRGNQHMPLAELCSLATLLGRPSIMLPPGNIVWAPYGNVGDWARKTAPPKAIAGPPSLPDTAVAGWARGSADGDTPPRMPVAELQRAVHSNGDLADVDAKAAMVVATNVQYSRLPRHNSAMAVPSEAADSAGLVPNAADEDISANALWQYHELPVNHAVAAAAPAVDDDNNNNNNNDDDDDEFAQYTAVARVAELPLAESGWVESSGEDVYTSIAPPTNFSPYVSLPKPPADADAAAAPAGKGLLQRMRNKIGKVTKKLRAKRREVETKAASSVAVLAPPAMSMVDLVEAVRDLFENLMIQIDFGDWMKRHVLDVVRSGNAAEMLQIARQHASSLPSNLLSVAVTEGKLAVASALIDAGIDPCIIDDQGRSVVSLLCRHVPKATERSLYIALLQISVGDDSDMVDEANIVNHIDPETGVAPLHVAVSHRNHVAVGFLVGKRGVDLNVREREHGWTPLHLAAAIDEKHIVAHLVRHGANPYVVAAELHWDSASLQWRSPPPGTAGTPYDVARERDHKRVAKLLDARQRRDQVALCRKAANGSLTPADLALALRRSQCHLFYGDSQGRSLLHWLAVTNAAVLIEQLFETPESAALLERRDRLDRTPLDVACQSGCYQAAIAIINCGAIVEPQRLTASSAASSVARFDFLPLFEEHVCGARIQSAVQSAAAASGRLAASALSGSMSASHAASRMRSSAAVGFHIATTPTPAGVSVAGGTRVRFAEATRQRETLLQRDLEQLPYFWGYMTAAETQHVLRDNEQYLLRNGPLHRFVVSFRSNDIVFHTFISVHPKRGLCVGPAVKGATYFVSVGHLLSVHVVWKTPVVNPHWSPERARCAAVSLAIGAHLTHTGAYDFEDVNAAMRHGTSTVVAVLAYEARSEREISFERGEVMFVVEGDATSTWVRLMHNGRISFAPGNHLAFGARVARALFDYVDDTNETALSVNAGDRIYVLTNRSDGWCYCCRGIDFGFVPLDYLELSDNAPMPSERLDATRTAVTGATAAASDDESSLIAGSSSSSSAIRVKRSTDVLGGSGGVERRQLAISSAGTHSFGDGDDDDGDPDADIDDKVDMVVIRDEDMNPLPLTPEEDDDSERRTPLQPPPLPPLPPPPHEAIYRDRDDSTPIGMHRTAPGSSSSHSRTDYWRDVVDTATAALSSHSGDAQTDDAAALLVSSSALSAVIQDYEAIQRAQPAEEIGGSVWVPARCPQGHELEAGQVGTWYCDMCRDHFTDCVRENSCMVCDYDLCEPCAAIACHTPMVFLKLQTSQLLMRPLCVRGHAMVRMANSTSQVCSKCAWVFGVDAQLLVCEACRVFVCRRCCGEGAWWLAPLHDASGAVSDELLATAEGRRSKPTGSLFTAAAYGDLELLRLELHGGAHVSERWSDAATPLHTAAWCGNWHILRELIDRVGVPTVDPFDANGVTPLAYAVQRNSISCVNFLLLRGADRELALAKLSDDDAVAPSLMALLVGSVAPHMPVESDATSDSDDGVDGNDARVLVRQASERTLARPFAEQWLAKRERCSRLHAHKLVASVSALAWQCDGARLFGCWQPVVRPGDVRYVCADGCEFSLCRVCVDGSESAEEATADGSSEFGAIYGYWNVQNVWTNTCAEAAIDPEADAQSAQVAVALSMLPRTVTIYLNRSLTLATTVTIRVDTSYADVERSCRDARQKAHRSATERRRKRQVAAPSAPPAPPVAASVGDDSLMTDMPPLPSVPTTTPPALGNDDAADADGDVEEDAETGRRCIYVVDSGTMLPFGNLALSELGPLATDARLRLARSSFVYVYLPHETQADANRRQQQAEQPTVVQDAVLRSDLFSYSWYMPNATRQSAEDLLRLQPSRTFVGRPARQHGQLVLSVATGEGDVVHTLLERRDKEWYADVGSRPWRSTSLPALLAAVGLRPLEDARARQAPIDAAATFVPAPCSPLVALMRAPPLPTAVDVYSELVSLVLRRGANVNVADERTSNTPLHTATLFGNEVGALLLMRLSGRDGVASVSVNARNELGETPLHHAARLGMRRVVEALSRRGAELEAETRAGVLPLDVAKPGDGALVAALAPHLQPVSLLHLPDEVVLSVLRFLPLEDLLNVSCVCRRLARVVQDVSLWPWSQWAGSHVGDDALMNSLATRNRESPNESRLLVGIVGSRQCGKSTLINHGCGGPWCDRVFGSISPKAALYEHGNFGGVGDLELDHYFVLPSVQRPWNVIVVCFDARSRTSWQTAHEWLVSLTALNAARRAQAIAARASAAKPETADALFCRKMHLLEHVHNLSMSVWFRGAVSRAPPICEICRSVTQLNLGGVNDALACTECSYVMCSKCAGASALAAAKSRALEQDVETAPALRPLQLFLLANARTAQFDGAMGELEHDPVLIAEAEQGAKQSGALFMMCDFASRRSTDAFIRRLLFGVVERLAAKYLRRRNVVNERLALRERALMRSTFASVSSAPYAELPIDPRAAAVAGEYDNAEAATTNATGGERDDVLLADDDIVDDDDDDDNDNSGKTKAKASVASQPTAETQATIVRALLQRQLRGQRLFEGRGLHASARVNGEMTCSRGHACVRSAFMPQPHIGTTVGSLFKVYAASAVAPMTVDGLALAVEDVVDVLELPTERGGLALGALNGVVGRFPIDVCRPVTKEMRDLEASSMSRKCLRCFGVLSARELSLTCLQCYEFVCRGCAGDLAFAIAPRSDWATVTTPIQFIAESMRDIVDERRREKVLDVPLNSVVMVLRDAASGQHSRPVVSMSGDGNTLWPESRAVLCAAPDGRVGWLPLLALDNTTQSVGSPSLRWRIAAAFHRNVCLIRATSGCPSVNEPMLTDRVVGDYYSCHTCATASPHTPMVVCGVCRTRCHQGHELQPIFAPPPAMMCACGAGRALGSTLAPCSALHEEGVEQVLPTRSVRVTTTMTAANGAYFFNGQVLDVVENAAPRNMFRAVRDPLVFTGVSYVPVGNVAAMTHAFPSRACVLGARGAAAVHVPKEEDTIYF